MTPIIITLARSAKRVFHKNASEVSFAAGPVHGTSMASQKSSMRCLPYGSKYAKKMSLRTQNGSFPELGDPNINPIIV